MTNTVVRCNVPMPSHGCAAARSSLSGVTSHEHAALVDEPIPTSELRRWGEEADDIAVLCCLVGRVGWVGEVTDWLALGVGEYSVGHLACGSMYVRTQLDEGGKQNCRGTPRI